MCILLKKNNAAFLGPAGGARDVPIPSDSNDDSNESDGSDSEGEVTDLDPTANKKCFKQFARLKNSRGFRALRGLVGLAVTGCASIDSEQMTYLCELLSFIGGSNSPSERNFQAHRNTTKSNNNVYHGRGLKLMDLCRNRLSDSQCAELLEATCKGPLEALDLGGNQIRRGQVFLEKFIDIFMKQTPCDDIGSVAGGKLKPLINPDTPKGLKQWGYGCATLVCRKTSFRKSLLQTCSTIFTTTHL